VRVRASTRWGPALTIVVLVAAVFGRTAWNGFVDFDDPAYITENPHVRAGLTVETILWAFSTGHQSNWHPLTWISHALDVTLFGVNPAGHHLVSAALHAASAVLLLLALLRMTGAPLRSAAVAALFAVHPLHVESVAWAAERKDVLSTAFGMGCLLVYAHHAQRPSPGMRRLLLALFALGLMAKPMLVTLPFVLLLLDAWPLRRWELGWSLPPAALVREKIPLFLLAAASSVVTWTVQARGGSVAALDVVPLLLRLQNAAIAYVGYLADTFYPVELGVLYPYGTAIASWKVAGACVVVAALTAATWASRRSAPYLLVGWLWYLGTLVPVIGVVQVGVQSHADRYAYVPLIGIFLMIAWGLYDLLGAVAARRTIFASWMALVVTACALLAWRQAGYWRDSEALFTRTLAVTEGNYVIESNFGGTLAREGRLDKAMSHLEAARRIRPGYAPGLSNIGVVLLRQGRAVEAIPLFRDALRFKPTHLEAWLNLGNALEKTGDLDGAAAAYREAERLAPGEPAISALARAAARSRPARAARSPEVPNATPEALASYTRANELRDRGRLAEAETQYREAIRLDPGCAEFHNNLGSLLGRQGRLDEAVAEIAKAVERKPGLTAAHINLGIVLAMRGDDEAAATQFAEVLRLDPWDVTAHSNLGVLRARQGRRDEAIAHFDAVLRIEPGNADASRALAELKARP